MENRDERPTRMISTNLLLITALPHLSGLPADLLLFDDVLLLLDLGQFGKESFGGQLTGGPVLKLELLGPVFFLLPPTPALLLQPLPDFLAGLHIELNSHLLITVVSAQPHYWAVRLVRERLALKPEWASRLGSILWPFCIGCFWLMTSGF